MNFHSIILLPLTFLQSWSTLACKSFLLRCVLVKMVINVRLKFVVLTALAGFSLQLTLAQVQSFVVGQPLAFNQTLVQGFTPCACSDSQPEGNWAGIRFASYSDAPLDSCNSGLCTALMQAQLTKDAILPCQLSCGLCSCCATGLVRLLNYEAGTSQFVQAFNLAGWGAALSNPALAATVFAPTDGAFNDLLAAVGCSSIATLNANNHTLLRDILAAHFAPATVLPRPGSTATGNAPARMQGLLWSYNMQNNVSLATANWSSSISDPLGVSETSGYVAATPTNIPSMLPASQGSVLVYLGPPSTSVGDVADSFAGASSTSTLALTSMGGTFQAAGFDTQPQVYVAGPGNQAGANIVINDLRTCRAVVHQIDQVLLPYGLPKSVC